MLCSFCCSRFYIETKQIQQSKLLDYKKSALLFLIRVYHPYIIHYSNNISRFSNASFSSA